MLIFTKITELQGYLSQIRAQHKTVGFVPTMGALHDGHVSLIRFSKSDCDYTICSIFVNPTQFNDKSDLERYPRMPEKDAALLESAYCDALFMPSVDEMYPVKDEKAEYHFGYLDNILEGAHRPGHFNGVGQIVKRLFEIVSPDKAYFGSKDYQQVMVVKALVTQMHSSIEIVACPILREPDGLAMSSRNSLLNAEERKTASVVPKLMSQVKELVITKGVDAARAFVTAELEHIPATRLDYFEICNADTLEILSDIKDAPRAVAVIAVFVGKIRLIDNLVLN
ncbi:pantoate--beta-alanine ligase [Sphingobacteriaceae bacterium]|nr:pantoate--beta-alanine ligase [Sphingobacteriaceae bacterium]